MYKKLGRKRVNGESLVEKGWWNQPMGLRAIRLQAYGIFSAVICRITMWNLSSSIWWWFRKHELVCWTEFDNPKRTYINCSARFLHHVWLFFDFFPLGVLVDLDAHPEGIVYRDLIPGDVQIVRRLYEGLYFLPIPSCPFSTMQDFMIHKKTHTRWIVMGTTCCI